MYRKTFKVLNCLKGTVRIILKSNLVFKFEQISPVRFLKITIHPLVNAWKEIFGHGPVSGCQRKSSGHLCDLRNTPSSSKRPFWRSRWLWWLPIGPKPGKGKRKNREIIVFWRINLLVPNNKSLGFAEVEMNLLQCCNFCNAAISSILKFPERVAAARSWLMCYRKTLNSVLLPSYFCSQQL